jgi:hypothetical protein
LKLLELEKATLKNGIYEVCFISALRFCYEVEKRFEKPGGDQIGALCRDENAIHQPKNAKSNLQKYVPQ